MNIVKKLTVGVLVATPLFLSGCLQSDEMHQFEVNQIGDDILNKYLGKKYVATSMTVLDDKDNSNVLLVMSEVMRLNVKGNCISQLHIEKNQIEVERTPHQSSYKIKEGEVVDTGPFFRCIDQQLETTHIEDDFLHEIINTNEYKNIRENPEFDKLVNQIKSDEIVTLHEGALILSYLHTQERNKEAQHTKQTVKNL